MSLRVMVIDDDEIVQIAMQRAIEVSNNDITLLAEYDGEKAIQALKKLTDPELVHMILLDLNMPLMNGFEFLDELNKYTTLKKIIVFILSTSANPKDIDKAYEYDVAGYLIKEQQGVCYEKTVKLLESYQDTVMLPYK